MLARYILWSRSTAARHVVSLEIGYMGMCVRERERERERERAREREGERERERERERRSLAVCSKRNNALLFFYYARERFTDSSTSFLTMAVSKSC